MKVSKAEVRDAEGVVINSIEGPVNIFSFPAPVGGPAIEVMDANERHIITVYDARMVLIAADIMQFMGYVTIDERLNEVQLFIWN